MSFFPPFNDFLALRREIDRALETALNTAKPRSGFLPGRSPRAYPLVNVHEDADNVTVEALAPGLNPDSLQITVQRNQLTIAGEKTPDQELAAENYHRRERAAGKFIRTFTLPSAVDEDRVTADYRSGILRVTLPKSEAAKPRKIAVAVS